MAQHDKVEFDNENVEKDVVLKLFWNSFGAVAAAVLLALATRPPWLQRSCRSSSSQI
jgi:hypothetical protein